MKLIRTIFLVGVILLGVTFALMNAASVTVFYYVGEATMPLSLLLVLTFAFGGMIGLLIGFMVMMRQRAKYWMSRNTSSSSKECTPRD